MESKYNIDNFEKFLRERTDDFKMYPSKRVWYSIYNNMHPGNRLPSVSMCIILICSLLLVGYLNTGTNKNTNSSIAKVTGTPGNDFVAIAKTANSTPTVALPSTTATAPTLNNTNEPVLTAATPDVSSYDAANYHSGDANAGSNTRARATNSYPTTSKNIVDTKRTTGQRTTAAVSSAVAANPAIDLSSGSAMKVLTVSEEYNNKSGNTITTESISTNRATETAGATLTGKQTTAVITEESGQFTVSGGEVSTELALQSTPVENNDAKASEKAATADQSSNLVVDVITESDKAWMENFALYNRPVPKKWAGKITRQAYITPSLVYRKLYNNTQDKALSGNGNGNFNSANVDQSVVQKPSIGIETGLSYQYDLLKAVRLKAGIQFNYTRYNAHAFENHHPIATSITLNSEDHLTAYEVFRTTQYSNSIGLAPVKLHNETYQLSLPIGADLKLLSLNNIAWYAGATIQPTFVAYANTYLISSDRRNYVKDKSMLNHFNMNAGFETYLSINTNGFNWQIGPQFRTQLFSTNKQIYSVEERLMSVGLKIGVSKKL